MRFPRHMQAAGLAASAALVLTACGTDDNTDGDEAESSVDLACEGKDTLNASGSSAQANAMTRFVAAYENACSDLTLDYNSSGSGDGVTDFLGGTTDFAGSDSPLNEDDGEVDDAAQRCGSDPWHLPVVFGPIAVSYNLEGVDTLNLDGPTIAKIFSGEITSWNDEEIAELNEGTDLPDQDITVVHRNDESGTTDNFQLYMETAAPDEWTNGAGKSFNGGTGEGAQGSEGVSSAVAQQEGSITYAEWSYAKQNELGIANVINSGDGDPIELNSESAGTAIESAEVSGEGNDMVLDLESIYGAEEENAYPLLLATYEIVCSEYEDTEVSNAVKDFLQVAITDGQDGLEDDGYTPVPDDFKDQLQTAIDEIA